MPAFTKRKKHRKNSFIPRKEFDRKDELIPRLNHEKEFVFMYRDDISDMAGISYILASYRRLEVILALANRSITKKYLAILLEISPSNLSRVLRPLQKAGFIKSVSPLMRKGARYTLAERSKYIMRYLNDIIRKHLEGKTVEPDDAKALFTIARYRLKVLKKKRFKKNWVEDDLDLEKLSRGEL